MGSGEKIYKVTGRASGMGLDRIHKIGDRASEGQAAGVYGAFLQRGLWRGKESGVEQGERGTRLVLTRS